MHTQGTIWKQLLIAPFASDLVVMNGDDVEGDVDDHAYANLAIVHLDPNV